MKPKNRGWQGLYLAMALGAALLGYRFYAPVPYTGSARAIAQPDDRIWRHYLAPLDVNGSYAYVWGMKTPEKREENATRSPEESNATKRSEVVLEGHTVCIEGVCFRLLGVYYENASPFAMFYSDIFERGLRAMTRGECLHDAVCIGRITPNRVTMEERNGSRSWAFELFDVNATKYKPKDTNATRF
jgi:hypothetical protein